VRKRLPSALLLLSIGCIVLSILEPRSAAFAMGWASCTDDLATHTWACVEDGKITTGHYNSDGSSVADPPSDTQLDGDAETKTDEPSVDTGRNGSPDTPDRKVDPSKSTICMSDDECGPGNQDRTARTAE